MQGDKDISHTLEGWEYIPGELSIRKVSGLDGKDKLQLRLDLGLLQMEMDERPDGKKPYGKESLLRYYLDLIEEHKSRYGTDKNFKLSGEDCAKLHQEGIQYYYRYLSLFQVGDYERAKRDTERNLRMFDLVKNYAVDQKDVISTEQYRAYVIMMNTRARCSISLERKNYDDALSQINAGIQKIEDFLKEYHQEHLMETSSEIAFLKNWAREIEESKPPSLKQRLKDQLQIAIEREEYERAAELRDKIGKLEETEED